MTPLVNQAQRPCILLHYIYIKEGDEPPWSINHRGLAYHYTLYIYRREMNPPGQLIIDVLNTTALHIYIYIYIYILYIYIYIYIYREMNPLVNRALRPCILLHCLYI